MGTIIDPNTKQCRDESVDEWLQHMYDTYTVLAGMADNIHHSRMQSGKACPQCIEIAIRQKFLTLDNPPYPPLDELGKPHQP